MHINRALVVRSPHAGNILSGIKPWEMRCTATGIRGRIGIIEAGSSTIIGEVDLIDCLPAICEDKAKNTYALHRIEDLSLLQKWKYPWVMARPAIYRDPVPYNHPKGAVIWVKLT